MLRRLQLRLPTLAAFKCELERNIVCGGALVETDEQCALEEKVDVEIDLPFCGQSVILEARVVNRFEQLARPHNFDRVGLAGDHAYVGRIRHRPTADERALANVAPELTLGLKCGQGLS